MKQNIFVGLMMLVNLMVSAQADSLYPSGYFKLPMDIPAKISGNFGELRPNHFHAGLDFTTSGKEGYPVKASADGYVSRIKISPWGYGKVVYVTHPNGYVTVYAHLQKFSGALATYVSKQQALKDCSWLGGLSFESAILRKWQIDCAAIRFGKNSRGIQYCRER